MTNYKSVFDANKELFLEDFEPRLFKEKLKKIFSSEEVAEIENNEDRFNQVKTLLAILSKKDNRVVEEFVNKVVKVDYDWLYKKFEPEPEPCEILGVPPLPQHNVDRTLMLKNVREELKEMRPGRYLVLHGMAGSGKTCLAAQAITDREVLSSCNGEIYWISVGSDRNDVLALLSDLNLMLSSHVDNMTDSIQASALLKKKFSDDKLKKALVVLDDVTDSSVVKAFSLGCKILITTKNSKVMTQWASQTTMIEVDNSFSEDESLNFLAKCVSKPVTDILPQAKELHRICKGYPMLMAQIGALMHDCRDEESNKGHLDAFIDLVQKKDFNALILPTVEETNINVIEMLGNYVEQLSEDMKKYYYFFSLFFEDTEISTKALMTIWGHDEVITKNYANSFYFKHLLVRKKLSGELVYGIHDLYLEYLRSKFNSEQRKAMHRELVDRYRSKCNGEWHKLPNDRYILKHLGYHLKESGLDEELQEVYTDLKFIEVKLKTVGPADLLTDYTKYRAQIGEGNCRLFEDLVDKIGLLVHANQDVDIFQCVLQHLPESHPIYQQARKVTKSRYILFRNLGQSNTCSEIIDLGNEQVTALSVTNNADYVLVGYKNGDVSLWDIYNSQQPTQNFTSQSGAIRRLCLNFDLTKWLSASMDGTIAVSSFDEDTRLELIHEIGDGIVQPKIRCPVLCANFATKSNFIVSTSTSNNNCYVRVWDGEKQVWCDVISVWNEEKEFKSECLFCQSDDFIIVGMSKMLHIYSSTDGTKIGTCILPSVLVQLMINPEAMSEVGVLMENSVSVWNIKRNAGGLSGGGPNEERHKINYPESMEGNFTSSALLRDIYVATSNQTINIYHWPTGQYINQLSRNVECVCMSGDGLDTLWTVDSKSRLSRWRLAEVDNTLLQPCFSASWTKDEALPVIAAFSAKHNMIYILDGSATVLKKISYNRKERVMHLCSDGKCITYLDNFDNVRLAYVEKGEPTVHITSLKDKSNPFIRVFSYSLDYIVVVTALKTPIQVFIIKENGCEGKFEYPCEDGPLINIFLVSTSIIAVFQNGVIQSFDLLSSKGVMKQVEGRKAGVEGCCLGSGGLLCIWYSDRSVALFNLSKPEWRPVECLFKVQPTALAFSPNSMKIAIGFIDSTIKVRDSRNITNEENSMLLEGNAVEGSARLRDVRVCDSGEVCALSGSRVYIISNGGSAVKAVLQGATSLVQAPQSPQFATLDSKGRIHIMSLSEKR